MIGDPEFELKVWAGPDGSEERDLFRFLLVDGRRVSVIRPDLDRAIGCAGFGGDENRLISSIRSESWFYDARLEVYPQPVSVRFGALAGRLGMHRTRLYRTRDWLVQANVLIAGEGELFTLNADYHAWRWRKTGEPLLTAHLLAYVEGRPSPGVGVREKGPIPRSLRTAVFERDAYRCVRCGGWDGLAADHVIPESRGGPTTLDNLQTLCRSCNSSKGNRMPTALSGEAVADAR